METSKNALSHIQLINRAKFNARLTLVILSAEGSIAMIAGILAGSAALLGFGIDSAIEGLGSSIILWRVSKKHRDDSSSEHKAQKLVAITFFILAPYIAIESIKNLLQAHHPETSALGIAMTSFSMVAMPLLGTVKKRVGRQLGSKAIEGEGRQNILCAYLAGSVLLGLLANTLFGIWWLDSLIGLGIAALAIHEGREVWEETRE